MELIRSMLESATIPLVTAQERKLKEPWPELDEENGISPTDRPTSTHCGRVHFRAHLEGKPGSYQFLLDSPMIAAPCSFLRKYGSDSMIRVRLPGKKDEETDDFICEYETDIIRFFQSRTFKLFERDFGMCGLRDGTVILFHDTLSPSKPAFSAIYDLWNRHNPLHLNQNQSVGKWAARLDLGFSSTRPIVQLDESQVKRLGDFGREGLTDEKLEANECMTDGCGYVNKKLMKLVRPNMETIRQSLPTAIQFRIRGCKGMALIRPDEPENYIESAYDHPTIWIRPSQNKISYRTPEPDQLILEVVGVNYLSAPARLGAEIVINLEYNGVPAEVFSSINQSNMQKIYDALTAWTGPGAMFKLGAWIFRQGRVLAMRRNRLPYDTLDSEVNKIRNKAIQSNNDNEPLEWFPDLVSGRPSTLYETAVTLIEAGFTPQNCPYLADQIGKVMQGQFDRCTGDKKLEVPMSAMTHIAPVPEAFKDLLGEGEIHFLSSTENLLQPTGELASMIEGEALIARYPCKVPSDFQRVKIVNRPELSRFVNIILLPIVGNRSLASFLSGGDYDGDQVVIIWQPEILDKWRDNPSNLMFANPPEGFSKNFEAAPPILRELLDRYPQRLSDQDKRMVVEEIQNVMLSSISIRKEIGMYSSWHDKAVAKYGYASPEAIRLAYMQVDRIDSLKSGKRVRNDVLERDRKDWQFCKRPAWKERRSSARDQSQSQAQSQNDQVTAMVQLLQDAEEKRKQLEIQYQKCVGSITINEDDDDLCRLWEDEQRRVQRLSEPNRGNHKRELREIKIHVENAHKATNVQWAKLFDDKERNSSTVEKQKLMRRASIEFANGPSGLEIYHSKNLDHLKASYLYLYDLKVKGLKGSGRPWELAMKDLCDIKAERSPEGKVSFAHDIAQLMQFGDPA